MWPAKFNYVRASSVDDALGNLDDDAKFLAGGHSLLPAMKFRLSQPSKLIDISRVDELKGISGGASLSIGAMATHAQIAGSSDVQAMCPALASAAGQIGDHQVRNFGTLGGNIAHADPASDPPAVLVACDARIHIKGSGGERSVVASDYFIGLFETDLKEGEIITKVEISDCGDKKSAYTKFAHPASRYAIVGVCVMLEMKGKHCASASIGIGGATVNAMRCSAAEAALAGSNLDDDALNAAASALQSDIADALIGDAVYPKTYRSAMAGVYLKRAVAEALG
jgi:aerobic carbon-monoxide dehydrogenase medium subunit